MSHQRIKIQIKRKPAPPPLDPFECLSCREMIERDPYTPDFNAPPVCWHCAWSQAGRTQLAHVPFSDWGRFRTAQILLNLIEREITYARHTF